MSDNIDDYYDFDIEDYKSKPLAFQKSMEEFQLLVPTLDEEGKFFVGADDLANWLSENQDMRPPGSGPDGEWTVGDEEAAMANFEDGMDFGGREPYDVLADKLHDQGYDFSPEGAEARQQRANELLNQTIDEFGTDAFIRERFQPAFPDEEDDRLFSPDDVRERLSAYEQSQKRTHDAARKAVGSSSPQGYIVHPDGFTEYFEDPEVTAQAKKDTEESERQYLKEQRQKREEASRRGKQDTTSTLGPTFQEQ